MNLGDPTPKAEIKQRQGPGGRMLDYVDARFVMDRLDAAAGEFGWQDKYEDLANGSVRCCIGIKAADGEWVWKCDVGDQSDIEPMKGAHSDAFKRAGVKWGIARDLYGDHVPPKPAEASRKPVEPAQPKVPHSERQLDEMVEEGYPWNDPKAIFPDAKVVELDPPSCPVHHFEWKSNSRGYYCSGKTNGKWCDRKPVVR